MRGLSNSPVIFDFLSNKGRREQDYADAVEVKDLIRRNSTIFWKINKLEKMKEKPLREGGRII